MRLFDPWTLLAAAAVSAPAWWAALVDHDMPLATAAIRFLIALLVCAVAVGALHRLIEGYSGGAGAPRRRAADRDGEEEPSESSETPGERDEPSR